MIRPILMSLLCVAMQFSLFIPGAGAQSAGTSSQTTHAAFDHLVDEFFDFYFRFNPTAATQAGFHQYDSRLEDYSRSAIEAQISGLQGFLTRFGGIQSSDLSEESRGDLEVLSSTIQSDLLELQTVQMWRRDPDVYPSGVSYSVFLIMRRNFAPPEQRLVSLIAREREIPKALDAARQNLTNPPRVYTEVALQQLPDTIKFFQEDVPQAFQAVKDAKLLDEFKSSNDAAVQALTKYQKFLRNNLLPASKGDFRLGSDTFREKLLYDEMLDIPLGHLLEIGYADLRRNQQQLKEVAAQIDPHRTTAEILVDLRKDHPPADQLLQTFRDTLGGLRQFIEEKKIITLPSTVPPIVEETPPFARALTTASMDTPGAYETKAKEAMFNVTLPDPKWKPEKIEEWMQSFNRGTIVSTAIHEVYPGHYTQFLWIQSAPSKTRKLLYNNSNAEGWAHYTEQMMLDEGYGNHDLKLRLGQLLDALLRDARFIVGIEMHTGTMTLDQAQKFFVTEGYQVPPVAEEEAKRGTSDPTYLYYTLGKLQILKLREDYRKLKGSEFNLQEFHDRFMRQGSVPMKIIRKSMLGDDSPTL
ncbi:MAG: DUF885 domain-containing protein [Terriglobales bacterium]|jgi:uncharacterized protein (DUF885 family)|nr:DUF885 domain-containing protein [Terriglobales bacterium]